MCYTKIFERQVFNPIKKKFQPIILFYITPTFKQEKKTNSCLYSCYKIEKKNKKGAVEKQKNNSCLYSCYKIEKKMKKRAVTTAVYTGVLKKAKNLKKGITRQGIE